MKNLKALIKIELKPVLFMSIYFLIVNLCGLVVGKVSINKNYLDYLQRGINTYVKEPYSNCIYPILIGVGIFTLGGIVLLVYIQFIKDKGVEVGRFLKALPYTNCQRGFVKIGMGILGYTLPFLILIGEMMLLRQEILEQLQELYNVLGNGQVTARIVELSELLKVCFMFYMTFTAIYLFLMLLQYSINDNLGSIVIGLLTLMAPPFIWISSSEIYGFFRRINWGMKSIFQILFIPSYPILLEGDKINLVMKEQGVVYFMTYAEIGHYGFKIMLLIFFIAACILLIRLTMNQARMEDSDKLFNNVATKWIFIIGVTLCSGLLIADIGLLFVLPLIMVEENFIVTQLLVVGGAVIGFIIAYKIGNIGSYKREEKR